MTATLDSTTTVTPTIDDMVSLDLYKDIHKGLRSELFGVTVAAGSIDPADDAARGVLVAQVERLAPLLDGHALHEDEFVVPVLEVHAPALAEVIHEVHPALDRWVAGIRDLADEVLVTGGPRARAGVHSLYVELASFTSAYLEHQDFEERRCMRALAAALPLEELLGIHQALVASIPPDEMAEALSSMLPAMNVEDRVELLGGMQAGAPPEVFAGVCVLAESVLTPEAWTATATRLGIG